MSVNQPAFLRLEVYFSTDTQGVGTKLIMDPAWNSWEAYYSSYGQPGIGLESYCQSGSHYKSYGGEPSNTWSPASLVAVADGHSCGVWFEGQSKQQPTTVVVSRDDMM